jgi:uncharacterized membrane protein YphA (DoxX/SURF4 family)
VAISAVVQGSYCLTNPESQTFLANMIGGLLVLGGIAVAAGVLTPLASTLLSGVLTATSLHWLPPLSHGLLEGRLPTLLTLIMTVSVLILGPGAFSWDARRFGRREIIIFKRPPIS